MRFSPFSPLLLTALVAACGDDTDRLGVGPSNAAPTAGFTVQCTKLSCTFTNGSGDSDGTIESYDWDFGDHSEHATGRNAVRTYAAPGLYTVTLVVTDDDGVSTTATEPVAATDPNFAPTAGFTFLCDRLECAFADGSREGNDEEPLTAYAWEFGDGGSSSDANPEHVYAAAGLYTVRLTVTDGGGWSGSIAKQLRARGTSVRIEGYFTGPRSRYLLFEDSTFALQYLDSTAVNFEFTGRYSPADTSLTFFFDANPGRWQATGAINGDFLIVTYNLDMQLSDFEDAVYLREVPAPELLASRYRF